MKAHKYKRTRCWSGIDAQKQEKRREKAKCPIKIKIEKKNSRTVFLKRTLARNGANQIN